MPRFDIDLPMYLALSAPDPTFDTIFAHVQRITGDARPFTDADMFSPVGRRENVKGVAFHGLGRHLTFTVESHPEESHYWQEWDDHEGCMRTEGETPCYGWSVDPPIILDDGSLYGDRSGCIEWVRLD